MPRTFLLVVLAFLSSCSRAAPPAAAASPGIRAGDSSIDGRTVHYLIAGTGSPVVLLHGYTETSHMWLPAMKVLAAEHTVIAPDLPGLGDSQVPASYDKKTLAVTIHQLVESLGYRQVQIVGHDLGMMVAYAYAAQFPTEVSTLTLIEAFLPGVGAWQQIMSNPVKWHYRFYGETPNRLVAGRERIYLDHFWSDFAADPRVSVGDADRAYYTARYARPGAMAAGFEYFRAFDLDALDFAKLAQTKLAMPVLVLSGERAAGQVLVDQANLVASDVHGVVERGVGHWLMEEAPEETLGELVPFLAGKRFDHANDPLPVSTGDRVLLTRDDLDGMSEAGTPGGEGINATLLEGDSTGPGRYAIDLYVPAHTTILAHLHPDQRSATVVSGTWYFGYGDQFDATKLHTLPPGSFYTEPANQPHFAQTRDTPVIVRIVGDGPTATRYAR